jgi:hypothetical protein
VLWVAILGCIACKDSIWSGSKGGQSSGKNLNHSENSEHSVMKDQGDICQDEIKSQHDKVHDSSTIDSNPQLPKDDSHFQSQMHSDLGSDKWVDAGSPNKEDLGNFKIKNLDWSNEVDQEDETKKKEKQKTKTPRYPFRSYGIRSMDQDDIFF